MSYKNKISFRFSAIYFTIFLVIGINAPFWPLWLSSKGLDSRSIEEKIIDTLDSNIILQKQK